MLYGIRYSDRVVGFEQDFVALLVQAGGGGIAASTSNINTSKMVSRVVLIQRYLRLTIRPGQQHNAWRDRFPAEYVCGTLCALYHPDAVLSS